MVNRLFWNKKKVFLTGHTGFKGGWLATWLLDMGSLVYGYALKPNTEPSYCTQCGLEDRMCSVIGDIREQDTLRRALQMAEPEIVIHMAAQSLVRRSYKEPVETFATNVMGTVHVLDAVRQVSSVRTVIVVTSDKCYENKEWIWGYREYDPMGGRDAYSASKGCAELAATAYRQSFFEGVNRPVGIATVRAGNVIGGGDWAEDRLVPDAIRALHRGQSLVVRNPSATRPWQHVLEPLAGYLMLTERLYGDERGKWAGAWNFGPAEKESVTVGSLCNRMIHAWGEGEWQPAPKQEAPHEAHTLKLDCSKARQLLGWRPVLTLEEAVDMTIGWYRTALSGDSNRGMYEMTRAQIREYEARWGTTVGTGSG